MSNTGQTPYEKYKALLGYLSSSQTILLANETIDSMYQRIIDLEQRIADQLKLIEAANDRISILEGDVKYMTRECEKAKNRNYDDLSTLKMLDELVNYRHIILAATE